MITRLSKSELVSSDMLDGTLSRLIILVYKNVWSENILKMMRMNETNITCHPNLFLSSFFFQSMQEVEKQQAGVNFAADVLMMEFSPDPSSSSR